MTQHSRLPLLLVVLLTLASAASAHAQNEQVTADDFHRMLRAGEAAIVQADYYRALEAYELALQVVQAAQLGVAERTDALLGRARARLGRGGIHMAGAREDIEAVLAARPGGWLEDHARLLLVAIARDQGDFRTAADTLEQLRPRLMAASQPVEQKLAFLLEEARTIQAWGDLAGAMEMYEAALEVMGEMGNQQQLAIIQRELARCRLDRNDPTQARALARQALGTDLRRCGTSRLRPPKQWEGRADRAAIQSMLLLADAETAAGDAAASEKLYDAAFNCSLKVAAIEELYRACLGFARQTLASVEPGETLTLSQVWTGSILQAVEDDRYPRFQIEALGVAGEIALREGRFDAAIDLLSRAATKVEEVRLSATEGEKRHYLALQAGHYRWLLEAYLARGDTWQALAASEALKARQLREAIGNQRAAESPARQVERLKALQRRLRPGVAVVSYANADWARTDPVAFVLTPDKLAVVRLPLQTLRDLAAGLDQAAVLAAQAEDVDATRYDLRDEITLAGLVAYFRSCIHPSDMQLLRDRFPGMLAAGRILHQLVFAPLEDELAGSRRLLLSPSGLLAYLPFDTLVTPDEQFVAGSYQITLTPSLLTTLAVRERAAGTYTRPLLAFGGAVYNPEDYTAAMADAGRLQQQFQEIGAARKAVFEGYRSPFAGFGTGLSNNLAGTLAEVRILGETVIEASIVTGNEVREGRVRELAVAGELQRTRVLHFAVHGSAVSWRPDLSCLLLSWEGPITPQMPADADGRLQITEIANLPIRADLAVLSACQTGLGAIVAGEGVIGLPASFMAAGVDRVVGSLWEVSDASAVYFMRRFYELHVVGGIADDVAIATVKLELLSGQAGASFRHPMHWAAFNLYGGRDLLLPE